MALVGLTRVKGTSVRNKGDEKGVAPPLASIFGIHFWSKCINKPSQKSSNNDHPPNWNLMTKGCQTGAKIDATNHNKSMPKLVREKITNII